MNPRIPTSCGYCTFEEADGELIRQCPRCWAADAPEDCPMCKGSGEVMRVSFADSSKQIPRWCATCKGTGKLSAAAPAQLELF